MGKQRVDSEARRTPAGCHNMPKGTGRTCGVPAGGRRIVGLAAQLGVPGVEDGTTRTLAFEASEDLGVQASEDLGVQADSASKEPSVRRPVGVLSSDKLATEPVQLGTRTIGVAVGLPPGLGAPTLQPPAPGTAPGGKMVQLEVCWSSGLMDSDDAGLFRSLALGVLAPDGAAAAVFEPSPAPMPCCLWLASSLFFRGDLTTWSVSDGLADRGVRGPPRGFREPRLGRAGLAVMAPEWHTGGFPLLGGVVGAMSRVNSFAKLGPSAAADRVLAFGMTT